MIRYITSVIFTIFSCTALVSCSDFLEQEPGDQVSIEEQLATKEGVLMALTGTYTSLEAVLRVDAFASYGDLQGGNLTFAPVATGSNKGQVSVPVSVTLVYSFEDTAPDSDMSRFYDNAYSVINQANLVLENVAEASGLNAEEVSQIEAEALTIRAFTHYLLTLLYAQAPDSPDTQPGIVYSTRSLQDKLQYPSRESLSDTYSLVISDLQAALEKYQKQVLEGDSYSYFNALNTKALLARVFLSANQWEKASNTAQQVMDEAGFDITSTENYISEWEAFRAPVSEILLELTPSKDQDGIIGGSLQAFYGYSTPTSYADYVASRDLMEIFEDGDIRGKSMFEAVELETLENEQLVGKTYYFSKKFQGEPGNPVLRLSEMYLIAAEAMFRQGHTEDAIAYLNVVRERAGLQPITHSEDTEAGILMEYRREFAFEGHYFFALKRFRKDIVRNDCIATTCSLNYPSFAYVLPIPQKNTDLNENLQQNEGY